MSPIARRKCCRAMWPKRPPKTRSTRILATLLRFLAGACVVGGDGVMGGISWTLLSLAVGIWLGFVAGEGE